MPPARPTPAAFLDRDGTIVEDPGFLRDPDLVRLVPGAAAAIVRLGDAGYRVVVVTNQSGLARGLIRWPEYHAVARRLDELLARDGAAIDATYLCPHDPAIDGPCACRKPGLALYRQAADELAIDLARSVWIGDRMTDLEPARAFGGRAVLVLTGQGGRVDDDLDELGISVAPDLAGAVAAMRLGPS